MGATGLQGRGTHAEIDAEVMTRQDHMRGDVHVTNTDCRMVGFNHHWHVIRHNGVPQVIVLTTVESRAIPKDGIFAGTPEWIYRQVTEDMGPYTFDCPLDLLDIVPPLDPAKEGAQSVEWSNRWRDSVREWHANEAARKAALKATQTALAVGTRFRLKDDLKIGAVDVGGTEGTIIRFRKRTPVADLKAFYSGGRGVAIPVKLIAEVLS